MQPYHEKNINHRHFSGTKYSLTIVMKNLYSKHKHKLEQIRQFLQNRQSLFDRTFSN